MVAASSSSASSSSPQPPSATAAISSSSLLHRNHHHHHHHHHHRSQTSPSSGSQQMYKCNICFRPTPIRDLGPSTATKESGERRREMKPTRSRITTRARICTKDACHGSATPSVIFFVTVIFSLPFSALCFSFF